MVTTLKANNSLTPDEEKNVNTLNEWYDEPSLRPEDHEVLAELAAEEMEKREERRRALEVGAAAANATVESLSVDLTGVAALPSEQEKIKSGEEEAPELGTH